MVYDDGWCMIPNRSANPARPGFGMTVFGKGGGFFSFLFLLWMRNSESLEKWCNPASRRASNSARASSYDCFKSFVYDV